MGLRLLQGLAPRCSQAALQLTAQPHMPEGELAPFSVTCLI